MKSIVDYYVNFIIDNNDYIDFINIALKDRKALRKKIKSIVNETDDIIDQIEKELISLAYYNYYD